MLRESSPFMYIHLRSLADFGTPLEAAFLPQILIMARCMLYELKASHGERYTTDEQILGSDLQRRRRRPTRRCRDGVRKKFTKALLYKLRQGSITARFMLPCMNHDVRSCLINDVIIRCAAEKRLFPAGMVVND